MRERLLTRIFTWLGIVMFAVLFYYALGITGVNSREDEYIYFVRNSVIYNLLLCLIGLGVIICLWRVWDLLEKKFRIPQNALLCIVCVFSFGFALWWIQELKIVPIADQWWIGRLAAAYNQGDFASLWAGDYAAIYPQQLGIVTLLRGFWLLFGDLNYNSFFVFNAFMVLLIIISGCMILRKMTRNNRQAEFFYLILYVILFPDARLCDFFLWRVEFDRVYHAGGMAPSVLFGPVYMVESGIVGSDRGCGCPVEKKCIDRCHSVCNCYSR